jgi:ATP-dependent DNA ligase
MKRSSTARFAPSIDAADHNSKICCSTVGTPCFFAFDLLTLDGKELRTERLLDRKQELRRLLAKTSPPFPLRYAEHVEGPGTALFRRVCELDLEGIVAKRKFGPYVTEREHSTWFKILNRGARQLSDPAVHWR